MRRGYMMRTPSLLQILKLVTVCVAQASSSVRSILVPPCASNVYCTGPLLHAVQTARIYPDSKTFVDLRMLKSENETLQDFDQLVEKYKEPSRDQIETFVKEHFIEGQELMPWEPTDFNPEPSVINKIADPTFKQFARDLVAIWPELARKVSPEVAENPDRYSLISIPNGFIIPGGRFKEIYYWDSYWIIEGLLISGMTETAKGMIENFLFLVKKFGHVPNGARVYYEERSQPPLLTAMAAKYVAATGDLTWVRANIETLEQELKYWLEKKTIEITKNGGKYQMLRYYAPSSGPRPESYAEDYINADNLDTEERREDFYIDIKSAAESGWDFSARWFISPNGSNEGNLTNIHTRRIVPVDLNSIFAAALENVGYLNNLISNTRAAREWWALAKIWRRSIDDLLWNDKDGIWYDLDAELGEHRKYFYPTNVAPLWAKCVESDKLIPYSRKVIEYLKASPGLHYPGGIPTSLDHTGEQWDFPNAWPPLQSILVQALDGTNLPEGKAMARDLAELWVRANYKGFKKNDEMFEKYDAEHPGEFGGGGEYIVQSGFGWTNGVVLELLNQFGQEITAEESLQEDNKA